MGSCRMWGFSVRLRLAVCQRAQRLHTYTNPLAIFATLTHHVHGPSAATISREMRDGIPQINRRIALSVLFDNTKRVLCFFFFFFLRIFYILGVLVFSWLSGNVSLWVDMLWWALQIKLGSFFMSLTVRWSGWSTHHRRRLSLWAMTAYSYAGRAVNDMVFSAPNRIKRERFCGLWMADEWWMVGRWARGHISWVVFF